MNKKIQDAMERAAEEFNNDVWGGEEDRCYIMSFKRGFKKAHSPEIIAMLEPEQLLANEAVRELVEAVKSTHMECWCSHDHVDCIKHDALAKFQKGGGE